MNKGQHHPGQFSDANPMKFAIALACGLLLFAGNSWAASQEKEIFSTNFQQEQGEGTGWKYVDGKWDVKDGRMSQSDLSNRDPKKAVLDAISKKESSGDVMILAKLRVDSWAAADGARVGIGVCTNPASGRGLNLVFHNHKLRLLHDFVAWGPSCDFEFQSGKWYWLKLYRQASARSDIDWIDEGLDPSVLKGKAWADGEKEPSKWMVSWHGHDDSAEGYPSLNGGSGPVRVSFADFRVIKVAPPNVADAEIVDLSLNGVWRVRPAAMESIGPAGLAEAQKAPMAGSRPKYRAKFISTS